MDFLKIGELASASGVNIETVRYYERRGIMPEPKRRESGYREYTKEDVLRLRFIKRAQQLGFSLSEISELLSLRVSPDTTCSDVKQQAEAKLRNIEERVQSLLRMKAALAKLIADCRDEQPGSVCPILEYLNEAGEELL